MGLFEPAQIVFQGVNPCLDVLLLLLQKISGIGGLLLPGLEVFLQIQGCEHIGNLLGGSGILSLVGKGKSDGGGRGSAGFFDR